MSAVRLRERHQITLPSDVVLAAGLETDDSLEVTYVNGIIQLMPTKNSPHRADISRFVGAAGSSYGTGSEDINQYVRDQRDSWYLVAGS